MAKQVRGGASDMSRNRKVAASSAVKQPGKVRAALHELEAGLENLYGLAAPAILVYGSQARGEANTLSDVDVVLLYAEPPLRGREIARLAPLLADLNLRYQVVISVLPSAHAEYEQAAGPFWSNIRREGVRPDAL